MLATFRQGFYDSLYAREDALFELTDALTCTPGPVKALMELSLEAEHRRSHSGMYAAMFEIEPAQVHPPAHGHHVCIDARLGAPQPHRVGIVAVARQMLDFEADHRAGRGRDRARGAKCAAGRTAHPAPRHAAGRGRVRLDALAQARGYEPRRPPGLGTCRSTGTSEQGVAAGREPRIRPARLPPAPGPGRKRRACHGRTRGAACNYPAHLGPPGRPRPQADLEDRAGLARCRHHRRGRGPPRGNPGSGLSSRPIGKEGKPAGQPTSAPHAAATPHPSPQTASTKAMKRASTPSAEPATQGMTTAEGSRLDTATSVAQRA